MRKVKDKNLAELLRQLDYTPEAKRQQQLNAAERLLEVVRPAQDYPFDFVYYRITGFQPKASMDEYVLPGQALAEDLYAFIAQLSSKSPVPAELQQEHVYSLEDLAKHLGVSTKTIHRWRTQGLVARKFVFGDGRRRLGFLRSSVDRFVAENSPSIQKATQFKRLSAAQKEEIVGMARRLSEQLRSRHQIIRTIAQQSGRAHETIRYILTEYERNHPKASLFQRPSGVMDPSQAAKLYELYLSGTSIAELVLRFDRSRSSVYRIINQRRANALMARKIRYVASDEIEAPSKRQAILSESVDLPALALEDHTEPFELLGEQLLPEYLQILKGTPILNHPQEICLFRKYNCLKYMAADTRRQLDHARVSSTKLKEIESYLAEAEALERVIVEANLRLVVSIASRHSPPGGSHFAELVSKGNYALIKAVQEFDYTKGFRFGKRASLSIAKEYARVSGKDTEITRTRAASIVNRQRQMRQTADIAAIERTRSSLTQVIRHELDEREQYIILNHFGLVGSGLRKQTKTLQDIGVHLSLTKERIRQLELEALQKLRQCLSSEEFDVLTR